MPFLHIRSAQRNEQTEYKGCYPSSVPTSVTDPGMLPSISSIRQVPFPFQSGKEHLHKPVWHPAFRRQSVHPISQILFLPAFLFDTCTACKIQMEEPNSNSPVELQPAFDPHFAWHNRIF